MAKGPDGYDTDPEVKKQQIKNDREFVGMINAESALEGYKADCFDEAAVLLGRWLSIDIRERGIAELSVETHQFLLRTGKWPMEKVKEIEERRRI